MTDTVLRLLRDRRKQGSAPGHRSDDARLVLLVEGGSSRGAYSSGMTVAIEQLGLLPMFDAVYGSSAGALNAAWLLCGRAESTMHAWWDPTIMGATIDPRRALRRQPVVDTRFLVHTVYTEIMPMGFQEILDSTVEFHPIATDALTGQATDLHEQIRDRSSLQAALRASTAMPLLAGEPVEIDGRSFVDAGVSESVPVRTALAQKATHIVALRTRRMDNHVGSVPRRTSDDVAMVRPARTGSPRTMAASRGHQSGGRAASGVASRDPADPPTDRQRADRPYRATPAPPSRSCRHRPAGGIERTGGLRRRAFVRSPRTVRPSTPTAGNPKEKMPWTGQAWNRSATSTRIRTSRPDRFLGGSPFVRDRGCRDERPGIPSRHGARRRSSRTDDGIDRHAFGLGPGGRSGVSPHAR